MIDIEGILVYTGCDEYRLYTENDIADALDWEDITEDGPFYKIEKGKIVQVAPKSKGYDWVVVK